MRGREQPGLAPPLEFRVLGPLEVWADGKVPIEGRRHQVVLAMLLFEPGRVITAGRLISAIYDEDPPKTAETQLHICVSQLRQRLAECHPQPDEIIVTHSAGYLIQVPEDTHDLMQFRRHVARGHDAQRANEPERAVTELRAGLALWRGEAVAGITSRAVEAAAARLNEERYSVLQECLDLELGLRRHHEVLGELTELAAAHPLREKLHAQLALALYRTDRQVEALNALRIVQRELVEEYGLSPGEELVRLERAILQRDPVLQAPTPEPTRVIPRQLPAAASHFVGRVETLDEVCDSLTNTEHDHRGSVVVINGAGGVGKTALAVHAAHRSREHFPDGQLYAHLRGTDGRPIPAREILERFLVALGISPGALPGGTAELSALYRSLTTGRHVLVVLDDVAGAEQVLPLVPAEPRCALLATSRRPLAGLNGAEHVSLDVFDLPTSLELLAQVVGETRIRTDEASAQQLAEACGHLPLGLRIASAKLAVRPHWPIDQMVRRLDDERRRLDELTLDDASVRATISLSVRELEPSLARLLLLLATLGNSSFASWVAAPLLDVEPYVGDDMVETLVEAQLLDVDSRPGRGIRYRLHSLTGAYARELAELLPPAERNEAVQRLLRCFAHLAGLARRREDGGDTTPLRSGSALWELPSDLVEELIAEPLAWFETERANLVAAIRRAAERQDHELCRDLAVSLVTLFETCSYYEAWRDTHEQALAAVRKAGDRRGEAVLRYSLGGLGLVEQRLDHAQRDLDAALAWFEEAGDVHGRGLAHRYLAVLARLTGDYETAQAHCVQALDDLQSVGDKVEEAYVLRNLAQIRLETGRPAEAEALLRQSLAICTEVGAVRIEAQVRYRLGEVLVALGEADEAAAAFGACLQATERTGDSVGESFARLGLGRLRLDAGEPAAAEATLGEALAAARRGASRLAEGQVLVALAEAAAARDDRSAAHARLDGAEAIFAEIGTEVWRTRAAVTRLRLPA